MANFFSTIFGGTPNLPSPQTTQGQAISGNTSQLGNLGILTQGSDKISAEGAALPYQLNLPDYTGMLSSFSGNVGQQLQGQLPQDVENLLQQQSAERGIGVGEAPGSPNDNAAYLQALGLTSLGEQQQGEQGFGQLVSETPTGQPFNPASMFVDPESQQAYGTAQAYLAAAPSPIASGVIQMLESISSGLGGGGGGASMAGMF